MATAGNRPATSNPFGLDRYVIRRKVLALFAQQFHVYDEMGNMVGYVKQKAFKLKEDIRLYSDESMATELLLIRARQILDISAAYDVIDSETGQKVGVLKRKGFKSILKDEWIIMDAGDHDMGMIQEDSMLLALLRRFLTALIPQKFQFQIRQRPVGMLKQAFNPFVFKAQADFSEDPGKVLDRRLGLAAVVLLLAIEGRQK
jgi:uncharacterized protein YxjI